MGSPKGGKKKLTKAEKEKIKKEEEEKRRQEEEEARIKAEQEESERLEREKQEEEERKRLENEERKRRKGQLIELEQLWDDIQTSLRQEDELRRSNDKWERYMKCDGSPDPTEASQINTYMNLWEENTKDNSIETIQAKSAEVLGLIKELQFLLRDTPAEDLSEKVVIRYKNTIEDMQALLQRKLNLASHDVLCKASLLADQETNNLQLVNKSDEITLCMWGNISKNPRIKMFEFEEKGFSFDLPKILTLSDIAFRILFTKFDHFTPRCRTCMPRRKILSIRDPTPAPEEPAATDEENVEAEKVIEEQEEQPENEDVMKALDHLEESEDTEDKEEPKEELQEEVVEEDYEIRTPEPQEWEDFDGDDDAVDMRAYHVMGGVFHFNLLNMPPQPKTINNWTMTLLVEPPGLSHHKYEVDKEKEEADTTVSELAVDANEEPVKKDERPPISIKIKLPSDVYFSEEPQIVRWDEFRSEWRLDGFTDHNFDEDAKLLSFKTSVFGVMALIQDAHINMPFQSWELRPRGVNHAKFTVIAAIVEVEIEIKDGLCCVVVPEDCTEMAHLKDKWMSAYDIKQALMRAGYNIFPAPDSSKYVSVQNKNAITEERLYQQMALTSSTMAYSWSKWNSEIADKERIVVQCSEHLIDEALLEDDWSLFLVSKKRTTKLKMTEFDEAFSDDYAEGTEFHADVYHMALDIASEEGCSRIKSTSNHYIDTVYQLLQGTRVITYS